MLLLKININVDISIEISVTCNLLTIHFCFLLLIQKPWIIYLSWPLDWRILTLPRVRFWGFVLMIWKWNGCSQNLVTRKVFSPLPTLGFHWEEIQKDLCSRSLLLRELGTTEGKMLLYRKVVGIPLSKLPNQVFLLISYLYLILE